MPHCAINDVPGEPNLKEGCLAVLTKMIGAEHFKVASYRFSLLSKEELLLPQYKGSALRGSFGHILKRVCCSVRDCPSCGRCVLNQKCPYAYIFETTQPNEDILVKRLKDVPRPFVLEPPEGRVRVLPAGHAFLFHLSLIGRAIAYFPYFLVAFKELGESGLGRTRGKFTLDKVFAFSHLGESAEVYSSETNLIHTRDLSFTLSDLDDGLSASRCTIDFLTPARLKSRESLRHEVDFYTLFSRLLERIQALSLFHCDSPAEIDYLSLKRAARKITTERSSLVFTDWVRYSSRQRTKMSLGGYVGKITYSGDLTPFLPFLRMGQWVHVGKNPTFGLGKYKLELECAATR